MTTEHEHTQEMSLVVNKMLNPAMTVMSVNPPNILDTTGKQSPQSQFILQYTNKT